MRRRLRQFVLTASLCWTAWLAMSLTHELGHVIGAICTGGKVTHLVWHPAALSRTDVQPNPHPLIEVWAGPMIGALVPAVFAALLAIPRNRYLHLACFFAGFCLIANGAYLGLGAIWPVGDAKVLVGHGTPRWCLAVLGLLATPTGFVLWHQASRRLGFGPEPSPISNVQMVASLSAAVTLSAISFALDLR